jgi:hypothetical protein
MAKETNKPIIPEDDAKKIGKDVPFKKSYQPTDDDLDSSKPPQSSGGPPSEGAEDEGTDD